MDLTLEQGKTGRNCPPEEKGVGEMRRDELTNVPLPCPLVLLGEKEVEKIRSEIEPGKKGVIERFSRHLVSSQAQPLTKEQFCY